MEKMLSYLIRARFDHNCVSHDDLIMFGFLMTSTYHLNPTKSSASYCAHTRG
jgi:hypothetical protein